MIFHGTLTITVHIASAMAAILPVERDHEVPPSNSPPNRADTIPDFKVQHLKAQAVPVSDRDFISFDVVPYPQANPSYCHVLGTTLTHTLSPVPKTRCDPGHNNTNTNATTTTSSDSTANDHVWFSFTPKDDAESNVFGTQHHTTTTGGGAYLKIVRQVDEHTRDEAVQFLSGEELPMVGYGRLAHQVYTGPEDLSVGAVRYGGLAR